MSTHYVRDGNLLRDNRADGTQGKVVVKFTSDQSEEERERIIQKMEDDRNRIMNLDKRP